MCIQAFADLPWHVVMSIGSRVDAASLQSVPPNFEVRSLFPQLAIQIKSTVV
jgi:UDP:flavonoid glycosyltransferase YjiC (YdhE family)